MRRNTQRGFSLVELMVAMVVTLFVVGAMFGLLTSGQSAFKTQPERTDRQQNIRAAMDLIMRDIGAAGIGMPVFMQVFSPNQNSVGPATSASPDPSGALTDQITMISNTEGWDNEYACNYPGGVSSGVFMRSGSTRLQDGQTVIVVMTDGTWSLRTVTGTSKNPPNTSSGNCDQGKDHQDINFVKGQDTSGLDTAGGLCQDNGYGTSATSKDCSVDYISSGDIISYRVCVPGLADCVAGDPGVPNLERRENVGNWQVLARGIEDMQVKYVPSAVGAAPVDSAPLVQPIGPTPYQTLTVQVRVTLSARGSAGRYQGATNVAQGPMAIRASLASQASPRMALWSLSQQPSPDPGALPWN